MLTFQRSEERRRIVFNWKCITEASFVIAKVAQDFILNLKKNFFNKAGKCLPFLVLCPSSKLGMACDGRNVITMINAGANSYNNDTWGRRRINQTIVIIFWHKYINYFLFVSHISSFLTVHIVVIEGNTFPLLN